MEWILGGGILGALVLLYFTAKSNGKKQAIIEQQNLQINAIAHELEFVIKDMETVQKQIFQWEHFRESVQDRLKGLDLALVPDATLQQLHKDPTIIVEVTDPYSTKVGESSRSIGEKELKK